LPDQKFLPGKLGIYQKIVNAWERHESSVVPGDDGSHSKKLKDFGDSVDEIGMFSDRHMTGPVPTGKKRSVFMERIVEIGRWLAAPPPEPSGEAKADWYAGLSVDPGSFTDQLCKLQDSLRRAGQAVRQEVEEGVVVNAQRG
jgi:hypothetical protein